MSSFRRKRLQHIFSGRVSGFLETSSKILVRIELSFYSITFKGNNFSNSFRMNRVIGSRLICASQDPSVWIHVITIRRPASAGRKGPCIIPASTHGSEISKDSCVQEGELIQIEEAPKECLLVRDVMEKAPPVAFRDETLYQVLDKMYRFKAMAIPVVDKDRRRKLLVIVTVLEIIKGYESAK
jgi:CBS domain-containing protein